MTNANTGSLTEAVLGDKHGNPPADANAHEIHAGMGDKKGSSGQYSNDPSGNHDFKPLKEPLDQIYQKPGTQPSASDIYKAKDKVDADDDDEDSTPRPANPKGYNYQDKGKISSDAISGGKETWGERPKFEKALAAVVSLLPEEVHMRELIRKVEGTGKEKMREMGLRTRAYKKYLQAWEAVHLDNDSEGNIIIRDDVLPYLRAHQQDLSKAELSEDGIGEFTFAQTIRAYEAYRVFLNKFAALLFPWTAPYFSDHMSLHASFKKGGRGIVLTAGDDQAPYLLTTIYSFRQLGCTLPIEVMYLGDQDLGEDYRAELEALPGVITRDIAQMTNDEGWKLAGWAAKPFAMLLSSFREAIFIDADSLFFVNPEVLFDDPGYKKTGALFFRDRKIMPENKKRWLQQVLPKPIPKLAKQSRFWTGESGHMQESGVVVIDKWKHFVSLMLITRFNGPDRDGNKEKGITGVYDMMYGDKETFWIGFLLAGDEQYHFHEGDAGIMGEVGTDKTGEKVVKNKSNHKRDIEAPNESSPEQKDSEEGHEHEEQHEENKQNEIISNLPEVIIEDDDENPSNYTICAPQLLHFTPEGKPLWFNGWLLHNKFAEKHKKRFANFESYLIEPRDVREPGAWQLAESNMCCLTSDVDKKFDFSPEELSTLDMIMTRAREMGKLNDSLL